MEIAFTESVPITDQTSVGAARRSASTAAARLGLNETRAGEFALLATEVSRNVLIHGGGGQVIVTGSRTNGADPVARILALDGGKGIDNLAQALTDGYSTAGTMGAGMGAMKRLATRFEVFTGRSGTIVLLELGDSEPKTSLQFAGVILPYPGEHVSGDGWHCESTSDRAVSLLVDGLGHGRGAAEAAQEAITTFRQRSSLSPAEILSYVHDALKKTRGAVAAVTEILPSQGVLKYAGVGNISASIMSGGKSRSLISYNGTLGMVIQKVQELRFEWAPDSVFVKHSDGLQSKWDLFSYSGLIFRHPALICGALIRDFRRHRDDAGVVVFKAA
jgi:anti-sigma regulatory factor (Ser/Thr protein kinase)